ncbi:MAG: hypothetical protein F4X81_03735 [Gammaproteobacteria bacterium]|nr:hypothetical protein [Gammaproteobacteria bacterium]
MVGIGKLKREEPSVRELQGLLASAESRLADATNDSLSFASRFDLAYNASHALALYALRRLGYRCEQRYVAFQSLPHTVGMRPEYWRVLAKGHERRNLAEYEGYLEHDERLLADLTETAERLLKAVTSLPPAEWSDE